MDVDMDSKLHIVMFPWLAFGHLLPFLKLSRCLAGKGHQITFLSTPRNIDRLPQHNDDSSSLGRIKFVKLPPLSLPKHLPPDAEATRDLSPDQVEHLKKAVDEGVQESLVKFLEQAQSHDRPDWIIHDFAHYWAPSIASKFGVRSAYFSVYPAACLSFCGPPSDMMAGEGRSRKSPENFTVSPDWVIFPSQVYFRPHEAEWFINAYLPNASGVSDMYRFGATLQQCDAVFLRTSNEHESQWIHLLQTIYQKPVIPTGMLPFDPNQAKQDPPTSGSRPLFQWLDEHEEQQRSVLYVALGSEATLSLDLIHELALGLEDSQVPFLWALRRPIGLSEDVDLLPKCFEDRVKGRGLVTIGFAPQLEILSHSSVGGFLNHAGWSSIIEGIQRGLPMIFLPIFADQGLTTRVMVEKKVGVELPRDERDGTFTRSGVAQAIRKLMVDQNEFFTANAKEMKKVFDDFDLNDGYINDFVSFLKANK